MPADHRGSLTNRLFEEGYAFDFFQAVRLLARRFSDRRLVGRAGPADQEIVRFRVNPTLDFPPSTVHSIQPPKNPTDQVVMAVNFLGLTGASGVLPRVYTEQIIRLERFGRGHERYALRDWLDLFNHRFLSLFFRAWEKYRFPLGFERMQRGATEEDPFLRVLFSLVGLGMTPLKNRLAIAKPTAHIAGPAAIAAPRQRLIELDDLGVLRFTGFFAHRPRNAISLELLLGAYLRLPVKVLQFVGQWIRLPEESQSSMGGLGVNNRLGTNVIVGDRLWDVQSKLRVQLGPLNYSQFLEYVPDRTPVAKRKAIFLVAQMVRLYAGAEFDVDIQLVLKAEEVPGCQLGPSKSPIGARLGWNAWSHRKGMKRDADDAIFQFDDQGALDFEVVKPPRDGVL